MSLGPQHVPALEGMDPAFEPEPDRDVAEWREAGLSAYAESDDVATQFLETPRPEPGWIVQVSHFDRRLMSLESLRAALESGVLEPAQTLVWRLGMRDWRAAARVEELWSGAQGQSRSAESVAVARSALARSSAAEVYQTPSVSSLLVLAAAVLVSLALTVAVLALGGVFEPGEHTGEQSTR